jgi:hypothetical protein
MTNYEEPDPLDPEGDLSLLRPAAWVAGSQIRQFGVGGASTTGQPPTVLAGLAAPPAAMVTAAAKELAVTCVTENDLGRYFPSATYLADMG